MKKEEGRVENYLFVGLMIVLLSVVLIDTKFTGEAVNVNLPGPEIEKESGNELAKKVLGAPCKRNLFRSSCYSCSGLYNTKPIRVHGTTEISQCDWKRIQCDTFCNCGGRRGVLVKYPNGLKIETPVLRGEGENARWEWVQGGPNLDAYKCEVLSPCLRAKGLCIDQDSFSWFNDRETCQPQSINLGCEKQEQKCCVLWSDECTSEQEQCGNDVEIEGDRYRQCCNRETESCVPDPESDYGKRCVPKGTCEQAGGSCITFVRGFGGPIMGLRGSANTPRARCPNPDDSFLLDNSAASCFDWDPDDDILRGCCIEVECPSCAGNSCGLPDSNLPPPDLGIGFGGGRLIGSGFGFGGGSLLDKLKEVAEGPEHPQRINFGFGIHPIPMDSTNTGQGGADPRERGIGVWVGVTF